MTRWLLVCPLCDHKFPHIRINEETIQEAYLDSYGTDRKPEIGARKLTCPRCERESDYGQFTLIREDDSDESAKGKGA
jgi:uncharacterized protein YbaR (Trm112 family)